MDSENLRTTLSTRKKLIYKNIGSDLNVIRFEFKLNNVNQIVCIPCSTNVTGPGTTQIGLFLKFLKHTLVTSCLQIDSSESDSKSYSHLFVYTMQKSSDMKFIILHYTQGATV